MTITFEITDETAALVWGDHHREGKTKPQVAEYMAHLAKSHLESKATRYKRGFPSDAARDTEAFKQLPQS